MQEKVNCSFSSGGSNLHSAQAIITSPLLLSYAPLVYCCTLYSKHGHLWITTPSAYVHAMRVIVLFIGFHWPSVDSEIIPNAERKLANFDSALLSRCDLQLMTFRRVPTGTVRHLNYKRGLCLRLMMEPGGGQWTCVWMWLVSCKPDYGAVQSCTNVRDERKKKIKMCACKGTLED